MIKAPGLVPSLYSVISQSRQRTGPEKMSLLGLIHDGIQRGVI